MPCGAQQTMKEKVNLSFFHINDKKPLFYYTALCAEAATHISPGQRPGFDFFPFSFCFLKLSDWAQ
jgi:hypothetical protein